MTTQIPYGPPGADYPQFASGHAQYPPAGYQHPVHAHPAVQQQPVETPPAQIPHQAYPTAPPWAAQTAEAAPVAEAAPAQSDAVVVTPYGSAPQVGGLLVPFPEEIRNAPRAQAPSVWPVAVFTFFFSVFGAISAYRRAGHARRGRNSTAPYWVTFVVVGLIGGFLWTTAATAVAIPVYLQVREGATIKALEENVLHDGQLAKANVIASEADCRPAGEWVGDKREFLCELTLSNGRTGRVLVSSDSSGNWKPVQKKK